jgi:hypothetical protein
MGMERSKTSNIDRGVLNFAYSFFSVNHGVRIYNDEKVPDKHDYNERSSFFEDPARVRASSVPYRYLLNSVEDVQMRKTNHRMPISRENSA